MKFNFKWPLAFAGGITFILLIKNIFKRKKSQNSNSNKEPTKDKSLANNLTPASELPEINQEKIFTDIDFTPETTTNTDLNKDLTVCEISESSNARLPVLEHENLLLISPEDIIPENINSITQEKISIDEIPSEINQELVNSSAEIDGLHKIVIEAENVAPEEMTLEISNVSDEIKQEVTVIVEEAMISAPPEIYQEVSLETLVLAQEIIEITHASNEIKQEITEKVVLSSDPVIIDETIENETETLVVTEIENKLPSVGAIEIPSVQETLNSDFNNAAINEPIASNSIKHYDENIINENSDFQDAIDNTKETLNEAIEEPLKIKTNNNEMDSLSMGKYLDSSSKSSSPTVFLNPDAEEFVPEFITCPPSSPYDFNFSVDYYSQDQSHLFDGGMVYGNNIKKKKSLRKKKSAIPTPTLGDFLEQQLKDVLSGKRKKSKNASPETSPVLSTEDLKKRKTKHSKKVKCIFGSECMNQKCTYEHDVESNICKFYPECKFGEECKFIHEDVKKVEENQEAVETIQEVFAKESVETIGH